MKKIFSSKYYLKKEIDYLLNKMYQIKTNFELFKDMQSGEEKRYISDNTPTFSRIVLSALSKNIFLELSKIIVDTSDYQGMENICIPNLIEKYSNNKNIFKLKKCYYVTGIDDNKKHRVNLSNQDVDSIIKKLSDKTNINNKVYNHLKKMRNKELAHNDKAFGFKTRKKYIKEIVTYKEIEDYINELYNDLNELNKSLFSTTTVFKYEYKNELEWLTEIIKNHVEDKE